jgi:MFS family permease
VLADGWLPEQRGHSSAISTFIPLLGPALGPIIGGLITGSVGCRWLFWVLPIFDVVLMLSDSLLSLESYASTILRHKARALSK